MIMQERDSIILIFGWKALKDGSIFIPGVGLSATLSGFDTQSFSTHLKIRFSLQIVQLRKNIIFHIWQILSCGVGDTIELTIYASNGVHSVAP